MLSGAVGFAEGRLAGFFRCDWAEYDHLFQSCSDRRPVCCPLNMQG